MACAREKVVGNMVQDFGAMDCIELVFDKRNGGDSELQRLEVGMVALGSVSDRQLL